MTEFFNESLKYLLSMNLLGLGALIFGLLNVYLLIKESIYNWLFGIAYIIISFIIFWQEQLYGDFLLHIFFLILNLYGWYHWLYGKSAKNEKVKIETLNAKQNIFYFTLSAIGIFFFGYFLANIHIIFTNLTPASVPYWDAATTSLSVMAMWLTARKKLENWVYWLIVDVLAVGIYTYKGIYFYALLYFIYIGLAAAGYIAWKKILQTQRA